jgi:hypothetical protein
MGAATALPVRELRVEPGSTTTAKMLVRNTGQVVDQFSVDVVGNCAEWTTVEPKIVNLLPGADVEITVTFAPAKSPDVPAGVVPFGVRVLSREDPPGSAVAEGTIEVAPFSDVQVELVPKQSTGRRKGKHQVAIDNNGNLPTTVQVNAQGEQEALDFKLDHTVASIEPGAAAFIRMKARPEKRFLKGADRQHQFVVHVVPSNAEPIASRGVMTQRQLLPSWLLPALAAAAVILIAAIVLYETLFKPHIESVAKDAALKANKSANSSLASQASSAEAAAAAASSQAQAAQSDASKAKADASIASKQAENGGGGTTEPKGPGGGSLEGGKAQAFSVQTDTNGTDTFAAPITIKPNQTLVITYMIMQNPNGDSGTLQVMRGNTEVLLTEGLANFRDLDHPFQVEPLLFTAGKPLKVSVDCEKPGGTATSCTPSILFTGRLVTNKST